LLCLCSVFTHVCVVVWHWCCYFSLWYYCFMLVLLFCVGPTTSRWCCYFVLVLLFCVGVIILCVGCAVLHIGVIISCWCYYISHWCYCFPLVVVLQVDSVASHIGVAVVSSCCCCYFMLVLLLCNF
jgi:hypothetical protein